MFYAGLLHGRTIWHPDSMVDQLVQNAAQTKNVAVCIVRNVKPYLFDSHRSESYSGSIEMMCYWEFSELF